MTRKQAYLLVLQGQDSAWIKASANNPSPRMSRVHIALHLIALRNRGEA